MGRKIRNFFITLVLAGFSLWALIILIHSTGAQKAVETAFKTGMYFIDVLKGEEKAGKKETGDNFDIKSIEEYSGKPYIEVNGNIPYFRKEELTKKAYESYSSLDSLGRCGACTACIGQSLMPRGERKSIGSIKPTGWQTAKYRGLVEGGYLYNRCHLIGYQLTGESGNRKNLITGTRYMNVEGMLPFENMVAEYVKETNNHVLYRVTPVFEGDNLLASGVLMEAESVEDKGKGICFNVFCYNVQPGVKIDYKDGSSKER